MTYVLHNPGCAAEATTELGSEAGEGTLAACSPEAQDAGWPSAAGRFAVWPGEGCVSASLVCPELRSAVAFSHPAWGAPSISMTKSPQTVHSHLLVLGE